MLEGQINAHFRYKKSLTQKRIALLNDSFYLEEALVP